MKNFFERLYRFFFKKNSFDLLGYTFQTKLIEIMRILPEEKIFRAQYNSFTIREMLGDMIFERVHILDFGCQDGTTAFTLQYIMPYSSITGVDISNVWIEFAQEHFKTVSFVQCKETPPLPFNDATFDVIIALEVLHHIPENVWSLHFKDFMRLLKPGGKLLIIELNPYNWEVKRSFEENPFEKGLHMISPWHIKKLMATYGSATLHFFNFFPRSESLRPFEKYLTKIPFGQQYACIVTKNKNILR